MKVLITYSLPLLVLFSYFHLTLSSCLPLPELESKPTPPNIVVQNIRDLDTHSQYYSNNNNNKIVVLPPSPPPSRKFNPPTHAATERAENNNQYKNNKNVPSNHNHRLGGLVMTEQNSKSPVQVQNKTCHVGETIVLRCEGRNNNNNDNDKGNQLLSMSSEIVWLKGLRKKYFRSIQNPPATLSKLDSEFLKVNCTGEEDAGWYACIYARRRKMKYLLHNNIESRPAHGKSARRYHPNSSNSREKKKKMWISPQSLSLAAQQIFHLRVLRDKEGVEGKGSNGKQNPDFLLINSSSHFEYEDYNGESMMINSTEENSGDSNLTITTAAAFGFGSLKYVFSLGSIIFNFAIVATVVSICSCLCCGCGFCCL